ncbi:MAG: hypothetical protein ABIT58_04400 [Ferruginibacter sp.]
MPAQVRSNKSSQNSVVEYMRNPLQKILLFGLISLAMNTKLPDQTALNNNGASHEYYIRLTGVNSRQDVEVLQNIITKKPGVNFFMANRYPARFFKMKADRSITRVEFEHFLRNMHISIEFYGEGEKSREQAILIYNKLKASRS